MDSLKERKFKVLGLTGPTWLEHRLSIPVLPLFDRFHKQLCFHLHQGVARTAVLPVSTVSAC